MLKIIWLEEIIIFPSYYANSSISFDIVARLLRHFAIDNYVVAILFNFPLLLLIIEGLHFVVLI